MLYKYNVHVLWYILVNRQILVFPVTPDKVKEYRSNFGEVDVAPAPPTPQIVMFISGRRN